MIAPALFAASWVACVLVIWSLVAGGSASKTCEERERDDDAQFEALRGHKFERQT